MVTLEEAIPATRVTLGTEMDQFCWGRICPKVMSHVLSLDAECRQAGTPNVFLSTWLR